MAKELGAASEIAATDAGGGLSNAKEAVYNISGNFFSWLSTHQGLALILILIVLGIMIWFILSARKNRKQIDKIVSSNKKEIGKKDALIEGHKNELTALQKKLSDQRGVVNEALLSTIMTITGYSTDQLQIFFKFLTQISGNPLQIADNQANTLPESQLLEEDSDDSTEVNDAKEKITPDAGPEEVVETNKSGEGFHTEKSVKGS